MLKIDIHTHILPSKIPSFKSKFGYGGFIDLKPCSDGHHVDMMDDSGKVFRRVGPNCFDGKTRIKECEQTGVNVQVLSTLPVMFNYWAKPQDTNETSEFLNDHIAETVQANPKAFVGLGTVPLQDPELASREAERCIKTLGFKGFQIGSHVQQWNLSAPELFPFFETCEKLDAALLVHPWDMMGQDRMTKYWLPWLVGMPAETSLAICSMIFGGVFQRFPKLRVAFAHGGGSFPFTLGRIQHGFEARPDLCAIDCKTDPKNFIGRFFVDSLVHDSQSLKFLIEKMGRENICLGSDYPFPLGEDKPGTLISQAGLDKETQNWLLYKSALKWLNTKETLWT
jgi:aminocarboxymuconate-semialdehyde decarboxylase